MTLDLQSDAAFDRGLELGGQDYLDYINRKDDSGLSRLPELIRGDPDSDM